MYENIKMKYKETQYIQRILATNDIFRSTEESSNLASLLNADVVFEDSDPFCLRALLESLTFARDLLNSLEIVHANLSVRIDLLCFATGKNTHEVSEDTACVLFVNKTLAGTIALVAEGKCPQLGMSYLDYWPLDIVHETARFRASMLDDEDSRVEIVNLSECEELIQSIIKVAVSHHAQGNHEGEALTSILNDNKRINNGSSRISNIHLS